MTDLPETKRHEGRVALVTGGASGIGAGTAQRLLEEGACVAVVDVRREGADALAQHHPGKAIGLAADVTVEEDVARAVDLTLAEFGRLDIVFANAGILGATGSILHCPIDDVTRTLMVDLIGTYITIKHAARVMVPQGSGSIIATSSPAGVLGGVGPHAYSAAKAGVLGLVRSVAGELRQHGVRVNAIVPGAIVTPMSAAISFDDPQALEASYQELASSSPLDRPGMPVDIAAAVSYLASDEAFFITGQALAVDGGMTTIGGNSPFTTGDWAQSRHYSESGRRGDQSAAGV